MIYTVTFNPAIDYVMKLSELTAGSICRSSGEEIYIGGKGINVSIILSRLGKPSTALGFIAGFTGEAIEKGVRSEGVITDFIYLENGSSRINVKIKAGEETELNGQGPDISDSAVNLLMKKLDALSSGDILVLAGSVPSSMPSDIYEKIMARLSGKDIKFAVDASSSLLMNTLKYKPFIIKPNNFELSEIFGVALTELSDIEKYARKLQDLGAQNVLVSMAENGSLLIDEDKNAHFLPCVGGKAVNSVGAGDSMLAGFIAGYKKGYEHAFKLGTACGSATALSPWLAEKSDIDRLFDMI